MTTKRDLYEDILYKIRVPLKHDIEKYRYY